MRPAPPPLRSRSAPRWPIPLRTGNLGVAHLAARCQGRAAPEADAERDACARWASWGLREVEDYVGWAAVEPAPGAFDWTHHRENARAARAAGMGYVAFPWSHAVPAWHRASSAFVAARCLEHGREGLGPSLFARSTWEAAEAFLGALREGLGDLLDGLVVGFPADYGEVGFPAGMGSWVLEGEPERSHRHPGLWCGEDPARAVLGRAGVDLGALREGRLDATGRLRFAHAYRGCVTRGVERLLVRARALFGDLPLEIKLGHASERVVFGTDYPRIVRLAARHGATVRSTHSGMGELFVARVASLCRTFGARFATEAPREIPHAMLVRRVFDDIAHGATSLFEFPEQYEALRADLRAVAPAMGRAPRPRRLACLYPTSDLLLEHGQGLPEDLAHVFAALRRLADVDLIDEAQVRAGALDGVAGLIVLDGRVLPADVLVAILAWVEAGGVLVDGVARAPRLLEDVVAGLRPASGAARARALAARLGHRSTRPPPAGAWRLDGRCASVRVRPGEEEARLHLGAGWHGRQDARWVWPALAEARPPLGPLVPARWTSGRAEIVVPRPRGARLCVRLDAYTVPAPSPSRVRVLVDGVPVCDEPLQGCATFVGEARDPDGDVLRLSLLADTHVPAQRFGTSDHRALGLLVRELLVHEAGLAVPFADPAAARDEPREPPALSLHDPCRIETVGAGRVLAGDGTPLSALAWLAAWLDGALDAPAPPEVARDPARRCHVTAFEGGWLAHDPDGARPARLVLPGAAGATDLAPLRTAWIPAPTPPTAAPPGTRASRPARSPAERPAARRRGRAGSRSDTSRPAS